MIDPIQISTDSQFLQTLWRNSFGLRVNQQASLYEILAYSLQELRQFQLNTLTLNDITGLRRHLAVGGDTVAVDCLDA